MKEKDYQSYLRRNNPMQNNHALEFLLDVGRKNILDDDYYNQKIKEIENQHDNGKGNPFMTKDFEIEIIKISRTMASMPSRDLYDYIQNQMYKVDELTKENDNPEYDY